MVEQMTSLLSKIKILVYDRWFQTIIFAATWGNDPIGSNWTNTFQNGLKTPTRFTPLQGNQPLGKSTHHTDSCFVG